MKAELKTKVNDASVKNFLASIPDEGQRNDTQQIFEMLQQATKAEPKMWGESIIGFGTYHYIGKSGREGDWYVAGVSPRKQNLTLYVMNGWEPYPELLAKLGKHSLGKGCLYIKRLDDVNLPTLKKLISQAVKEAKKHKLLDFRTQKAK
jgi:Domain of unknown function (DU1801)